MQLVLFAEIANNYVNFRTLQRRIDYAKRNIEIQRQTLQLTKDQFEQGIAPEVDLVRAKTNLYTTEAQLPSLLLSLEQAKNHLAVLVGRQAGTLNELLEQESKPHFPHNTYQDTTMSLQLGSVFDCYFTLTPIHHPQKEIFPRCYV